MRQRCAEDEADLALLEEAAEKAAEIALSHFRRDPRYWTKAGAEPVSEADIAVDRFLAEFLRPARPAYGWWSEESPLQPASGRTQRCFLVDPIDGTRAFLAGREDWVIALAVLDAEQATVGLVHQPTRDRRFHARMGGGAFLDGRPLKVAARHELAHARVFADAGRLAARRRWRVPWPPLDHLKANAIALRLAEVAAGDADALIAFGRKQPWDIAAGALLVEEAGGVCCGFDGERLSFAPDATMPEGLIACPATLLAPIRRRLAARHDDGSGPQTVTPQKSQPNRTSTPPRARRKASDESS